MAIAIKIEQTPNPNALKLTANKTIFEGTKSHSFKQGDTPDHPLVAALLKIEGIDNVFGYQDFITVNKTFETDWEQILPKVEEVFENAD